MLAYFKINLSAAREINLKMSALSKQISAASQPGDKGWAEGSFFEGISSLSGFLLSQACLLPCDPVYWLLGHKMC